MDYDYDAIVIGAGSGGLTSAISLTKVGKRVLLIEKGKMGGECANTGCIPSKTLIHHAREYASAKDRAGETEKLISYKERIFSLVRKKIAEVRSGESPEVLQKQRKVKVVLGEASFVDKHTVLIKISTGGKSYTAKNIIIATGSSPRRIDIKGLKIEKTLTNENVFNLKEVPDKLLIVGAGAIGCEMAQAFANLGTKVTIINSKSHLLPREETEISEQVENSFREMGIKVFKNSKVSKCRGDIAYIDEVIGVGKKKKTSNHKVEFDYLLTAVGRVPNTSTLNLPAAEIVYNKKGIEVDKHYRTSSRNIFAVGDVSSASKFTHVADDQGRHITKKILLPFILADNKKPIPRVTYLNEEVASVGFSYKDALKKYSAGEIIKISLPYGSTDRAKTEDAQKGLAIVIAKRISGKILGVSMVGKNAGELLSLFTLAIQDKISLYKINRIIAPYPTLSRLYKKLSDAYLGATLKDLKKDLKYVFWRHVPKVIALGIWLTLLIFFYKYKAENNISSLDLTKEIYTFVTSTAYGPILYMLIYAFRPIFFFPATLLTLISGALFGFWWGIAYTIVGENLSANLAYWIGRFFGDGICDGHENEGTEGLLAGWQRELQDNSFVSVLVMRFAYVPFDLTNYGCGLLCVHWPSYALATLIGIIPGLTTFVSLGATIENVESFDLSMISFNSTQLLVSIVLFIGSLMLARLVRDYQKNKKLEEATAS